MFSRGTKGGGGREKATSPVEDEDWTSKPGPKPVPKPDPQPFFSLKPPSARQRSSVSRRNSKEPEGGADQAILPLEQQTEWFARKGNEDKIRKFLEKKKRKQEKIKKILEKREAKALGIDDGGKEVVYKGIGEQSFFSDKKCCSQLVSYAYDFSTPG